MYEYHHLTFTDIARSTTEVKLPSGKTYFIQDLWGSENEEPGVAEFPGFSLTETEDGPVIFQHQEEGEVIKEILRRENEGK